MSAVKSGNLRAMPILLGAEIELAEEEEVEADVAGDCLRLVERPELVTDGVPERFLLTRSGRDLMEGIAAAHF